MKRKPHLVTGGAGETGLGMDGSTKACMDAKTFWCGTRKGLVLEASIPRHDHAFLICCEGHTLPWLASGERI
jgi:hypothetical protein